MTKENRENDPLHKLPVKRFAFGYESACWVKSLGIEEL
jgi:hypothetical protein